MKKCEIALPGRGAQFSGDGMAGMIRPGDPLSPAYQGLPEFFEFVNGDGRWRPYNCGQAAACTFLTHHGILARNPAVMRTVEREYPPDNLGGWFGTSRRCVERICRAHGLAPRAIKSEAELRENLAEGRPVIVMLGVTGPPFLRWRLPAGHWMVAYGFDDQLVYLSNQGSMTWDEFRAGWQGLVPRLIGMRGRGLVLVDSARRELHAAFV